MNSEDTASNTADDLNSDLPQYDRGIVPAETAARKEREGASFGSTREGQDPESIDTTAGVTTDKEGLTNIYPVEPEMYVEQPGDLQQEEEASAAEHAQEREDISHDDETGKLTEEGDTRGKGPGLM